MGSDVDIISKCRSARKKLVRHRHLNFIEICHLEMHTLSAVKDLQS
jgi:hypothetical protein